MVQLCLWLRDHLCAKFKIPYSYDHLVSISGYSDASIREHKTLISRLTQRASKYIPVYIASLYNELVVIFLGYLGFGNSQIHLQIWCVFSCGILLCCSVCSGSQLKELVHKNPVTVEGLLEDPLFTVVFSLFYEVGDPPKKQERRVSMSFQERRWGRYRISWIMLCVLYNSTQFI